MKKIIPDLIPAPVLHYFSYISISYVTKNRLEAALLSLLESHDRKIIATENVIGFRVKLNADIAALNTCHPRCKPIHPSFYESDGDVFLHNIKVCHFALLKSKN